MWFLTAVSQWKDFVSSLIRRWVRITAAADSWLRLGSPDTLHQSCTHLNGHGKWNHVMEDRLVLYHHTLGNSEWSISNLSKYLNIQIVSFTFKVEIFQDNKAWAWTFHTPTFHTFFSYPEVSAIFKSTTSARYSFREPYEQSRNASALSSSIYSDVTLRGENISLSFRTRQSPSLLLYVSSFYKEHLALLINKHGE